MQQESGISGWYVFAGILLTIAGILDIVWGIAAVSNSKFFAADATYILTSLHGWGWITIVIGVVELIGAVSLFAGNGFGRFVGIVGAGLASLAALFSITASPFWAICVFALAILVIFELARPRQPYLSA
jgi:hypothetical protein